VVVFYVSKPRDKVSYGKLDVRVSASWWHVALRF
jgi:hypothetical protein